MNALLDYSSLTDGRLVALHLDGDRNAFRQIVERHQAMVCALGVSAFGDVGRSEDLAQEVFIAAWKQLPDLREPEKLLGWLAGIARNLINNSFRRQQRTPTARAEELSPETPADAASPREHAISADEAALMWSALAGIPENYREPMVLFYREQRSVPAVAAALEISEEAVRQRLMRGRAMLTERMASLVEEALERSAPTPAFAGLIILALPVGPMAVETMLGGSGAAKTLTTAGAIGSAAAKGGLAVKALAVLGLLPALLGSATDYRRFWSHYDAQTTDAGRRAVARRYLVPYIACGLMMAGILILSMWGARLQHEHWLAFGILFTVTMAGPFLAIGLEQRRAMRNDAGSSTAFPLGGDAPVFEYVSPHRLLGLPLLHVRTGGRKGAKSSKVAKAWIAIGDGVALGGLFASGPLAIAPVSMGGVALGGVSVGGVALAGAALGVIAAGWMAAGGTACAWHAALGPLAVAHDFASGSIANAQHANDLVAATFMGANGFFAFACASWKIAVWAVWFAWMPTLLLMGWHLWRTRPVR